MHSVMESLDTVRCNKRFLSDLDLSDRGVSSSNIHFVTSFVIGLMIRSVQVYHHASKYLSSKVSIIFKPQTMMCGFERANTSW